MTTGTHEQYGVHARLRQETRRLHEDLEHDLDVVKPDLTLQEYQRILARFFGFYLPFEARVRVRYLPVSLGDRSKAPLLREDLEYFLIDPAEQPVCPTVPACDTNEQAWGALYVTEGATLGGQVIFQHLQASLGLTAETGARFFHGYGSETSQRWRSFLRLLEMHCDPDLADAAVASACATFRTLHTWLRVGL